MNRKTEQDSRWFITDITRHAKRIMDHRRTDTARLYVTEISQVEIDMLRQKFSSVTRDITGHLTLKLKLGGSTNA